MGGNKPAGERFGGEGFNGALRGPLSKEGHYIVFYEVLVCGQHESLSMLHSVMKIVKAETV